MLQKAKRTVKAALRGRRPFVLGMGKAVDIGNTLKLRHTVSVDFISEPLYGDVLSDYDRLKSDWITIGNDLRTAIRVVEGQYVTKSH